MTETPTPVVSKLLAEFGARMVRLWVDLIVVVFISQILMNDVLWRIGIDVEDLRPVMAFVMFAYLALMWASPLRATLTPLYLRQLSHRTGRVRTIFSWARLLRNGQP